MLQAWLGVSSEKAKNREECPIKGDKRPKYEDYEKSKRVRKYDPTWEKDFEWLLFGTQEKKMYCKWCRSSFGGLTQQRVNTLGLQQLYAKYSGGPFVTGCNNYKRFTLVQHADSEGHREASRRFAAKNCKPGESTAEKSLQQLSKSAFDKLDKLFRTAHAIAKNSRPFSDFVWMTELDRAKGVALGQTYINDKSCRDFVTAIAASERLAVQAKFKDANFLSILSDGSSDVSIIENEIVYARFALRGEVNTFFLALVSVARADAVGIYGAIRQALAVAFPDFEEFKLFNKLVGYGCDGASVNTGKKGGVITHLRAAASDSVLLVVCLVHRLESACKDAFRHHKLYEKVMQMLSSLFSFYRQSPKQRSGLKETFQAKGIPVATPTRIGGTRWVGHTLTALHALWKGYEVFWLHLDQVSWFCPCSLCVIMYYIGR